jgi:hypothetical protein
MKKGFVLSLIVALCLSLGHLATYAQGYEKGSIIINPGLGLGYWYGGTGFAVGFAVNAEFNITDDIAIGPYVSITRRSYNYALGNDDYTYTYFDIGARGSYHFGRLLKVNTEQFDPYAGAFLGFVSTSADYDDAYSGYYDTYDGRFQVGVYAGARWYFSEVFGVFGEVGVGMFPILVGVTIKVK